MQFTRNEETSVSHRASSNGVEKEILAKVPSRAWLNQGRVSANWNLMSATGAALGLFRKKWKKPIECFLSSVLKHLPRINIIRTSQSINKENVNDPRKKAGLIGTSTHSEANQSFETSPRANEVKINETRRVTCAFFEGPSLTGCNLNPELTRAKHPGRRRNVSWKRETR